MPQEATLDRDSARKIAGDTTTTYGLRGAGVSWQASFGMALSEADLLFAVRREPVANRIVFQVAHDIFDNWFKVEEVSEKSDGSFDREVQKPLAALNAKAVFTQFTVYERLFGWAIIAISYVDHGKGLDTPISNPKEIIRAGGLNPEQLLAKEALIQGNITVKTQADIENHQLTVLANELKLLIKQEATV